MEKSKLFFALGKKEKQFFKFIYHKKVYTGVRIRGFLPDLLGEEVSPLGNLGFSS